MIDPSSGLMRIPVQALAGANWTNKIASATIHDATFFMELIL
jgi:hypothetical protein